MDFFTRSRPSAESESAPRVTGRHARASAEGNGACSLGFSQAAMNASGVPCFSSFQ